MRQEFLVVFEKGPNNWSAFAPDAPGCGGLGDTLDETRADYLEGLKQLFKACEETGQPVPRAISATVDFNEFDPEHKQKHYVIEWLPFEFASQREQAASAAA